MVAKFKLRNLDILRLCSLQQGISYKASSTFKCYFQLVNCLKTDNENDYFFF